MNDRPMDFADANPYVHLAQRESLALSLRVYHDDFETFRIGTVTLKTHPSKRARRLGF